MAEEGVTAIGQVEYVGQRPHWLPDEEPAAEATEESKAEEAKPEAKAEEKPEAKAEEPKPEPKVEEPKPEEKKAEEPKPEVKAEEPKPEPKAEEPKSRSEASLAAEAARLRRQAKAYKQEAERQAEINRRLASGESIEGLTAPKAPDRIQQLEDRLEAESALRRLHEHPVAKSDPNFTATLAGLYEEFEKDQPDVLDLSPGMAAKLIFAEYLTRQAQAPKPAAEAPKPKVEEKPKPEPDTASKRALGGGGGGAAPRVVGSDYLSMSDRDYEVARLERLGLEPDNFTPADVREEWEKRRNA